jgi:predicted dehydrogenase
MVRLAIVGTAARAARHQAALERLIDVEIAAVVDPASDDGVAEVLARSDIDAIVLALPSCSAAGTTIAAARAGKRLIAEYAPGRTRKEVSHVAQTLGEHGASLELLVPERHQPLPRELKATLDAGKLGRLRYAHSAWIGHNRMNEPATQSGSADDAAGTSARCCRLPTRRRPLSRSDLTGACPMAPGCSGWR